MSVNGQVPHMIRYDPLDPAAETAVAAWWVNLRESKELFTLFDGTLATLRTFLGLFIPPSRLYFLLDGDGPYFAVWCTPFMRVLSFNYWVREDYRLTKAFRDEIIVTAVDLIGQLLAETPTLIGFSLDEYLANFATRFGFTRVGVIPNAGARGDAHLMLITREAHAEWVNRKQAAQ